MVRAAPLDLRYSLSCSISCCTGASLSENLRTRGSRECARVFSENISRLLNTQQIEKYPWPVRTHIDYQIDVNVQRFETTSDGQSQLTARWVIKDGTGKDLYASETSASAQVGPGETGASAALSSDLATLSRETADRVIELQRHQAPVSTTDSFRSNVHSVGG